MFFSLFCDFLWGMTDKLFLHVYCVVLVKCAEGILSILSFPSFMIYIFWTCLDLSFMACSFSQIMWFCVFGELAWFCFVDRAFMVIRILTFGKKSVLFHPSLTHQFVCFLFCWFFILNHFRNFFIPEKRKKTYTVCFLLQHFTQDPPRRGPWCEHWYWRNSPCWFCKC